MGNTYKKKSKKKEIIKAKDFYMNTTPEEIKRLFWLISDKIIIPYMNEEGVCDEHQLSDSEIAPVVMNGIYFQLNTKEFAQKIGEMEKDT
jgi:tyrosine-protein phosphatase YwqE|tara:strand:- start:178 stop:447 length:270 start_codon:yes stop_codon:yes gene_type:complete